MASQEGQKLNFYSKYNRVRDKQDIQTLYMLIDDKEYWLHHFDNLTLTLNCSRVESPKANSPIKNYHLDSKDRKQKSNLLLPMFEEEEKNDKLREMQQKLRKLQRLQKNFHDGLEKAARQYNQKRELKEAKRREREYYQNQLINVIEHISQHSQNSQNQSIPIRPNMVSSQIIDDQILSDQFQDHYMQEVEINDQNESDFDVKETKRKLKQILEMQKQRHKEVESVEQNNEVKTASIVIERMNFMPKLNQNLRRSILVGANTHPKQPKQTNNLFSLELNHSQSQKAIWNFHSNQEELNDQDIEAKANEMKYKESEEGLQSQVRYQEDIGYEKDHEGYEGQNLYKNHGQGENEEPQEHESYTELAQQYEPNRKYNEYDEQQFHQNNQANQQYQEMQGEDNTSQQIYAISDNYTPMPGEINYNYYEHHNEVDPPLTLAQDANNQFCADDTSEINQEINDHVVSIGDLSEQQSQPPNPIGNARSHLFLSQTSPRKTFQNQHEVQSIAQSLDFHPLENQHSGEKGSKSNILHGQKQERGKNQFKGDGDKKNSFKKLMAENRSNLVPRLAISTILNEHINEVLGDYRANQVPPAMVANLHESIISSQANSSSKPGKINFKQMLRRNKKNPSTGRDKTVINKDPEKVQTNKKLLMNFFDQN